MHGTKPLLAFLDPVADALADSSTTEIVCQRPCEVGIERRGAWEWRSVPEWTFDRLDALGLLAGYMTGRDFDPARPYCGSTLPGGQRIQICRPPATRPGTIALAIRCPPQTARKLDDPDFDALHSEVNMPVSRASRYDAELRELLKAKRIREFMKLARRAGKTIDVTGPTGSGKTDYARRLMQETDAGKRLVTIESDPEYGHIGPRNTVNLFYNEQHPEMAPEKTVAASLRMRPDEIWFQETKGPEAYAVLRARAAGHRGGGTTWHADEGKEIEALALMIRQNPAAEHLDDDTIRDFCLKFTDIIVWCARFDDVGYKVPRIWMKGTNE